MFTERIHSNKHHWPFITGAALFVFTGVGHLGTVLLMNRAADPLEVAQLVARLPEINLLGTSTNLFQLSTGFSAAMGVLLLGFGLLALLTKAPSRSFVLVTALSAAVMLYLSITYFFIVPIVTMGLATVCFGIALAVGVPLQEAP